MRNASALVLAMLVIASCGTSKEVLKVGAGNPRPNVDLPKSDKSLGLQLEAGIQDAFSTEESGPIPPIPVDGWRTTLERGFRSAFADSFALSDRPSELTLVIAEATPSFVGTSYERFGRPVSAEVQVRYKARLVDRQGTVLRRSAATVASKRSASAAQEAASVAAGAVESMYERIARDFFEENPAH
jgi:lipopolysaccharide assembly LptE-like protein